MPPIKYTPEAQADIRSAYTFLATHDLDAAIAAIKAIRGQLCILGRHPEAGRPTQHYGLEFREWVIDYGDSGYVALYYFDSRQVVILSVRHQKEFGYANDTSGTFNE